MASPSIRASALVLTLLTAGCLEPLGDAGACHDSSVAPAFAVDSEPPAALDAAPRVLRLHLRPPVGSTIDAATVALVEGEVGSSQLGQLARGEVSMALQERLVPAQVWTEGDSVVVAPTVALTAGASYTLASGAPRQATPLTVVTEDAIPLLTLAWPPAGRGAGAWPAVWCGEQAPSLAPPTAPIALAPDGGDARLAPGMAPELASLPCLRLEAVASASSTQLRLAPPAAFDEAGSAIASLEPTALSGDASPDSPVAVDCDGDELPIGPGPAACLEIQDDRARLHPSETPRLWGVASADGTLARYHPAAAGEPFLIHPLPPAQSLELKILALDRAGGTQLFEPTITTLPPMAHVVINEVLANPIGEEPQQEWVELYNDGLAPAHLADHRLEDIGGETVLPAVDLPPGAFALVVREDYDAAAEYDPVPPDGVLLLRVAELGKGGLNNSGEPLKLVAPDGRVLSRAPAEPKPKAGESVARRTPKALDGLTDSFVRGAPTPGAPNEAVSSR
ncbi:MAG: lamin tail domain-containing protein [Polyangiaceae bacterium]